MIKRKILWIDDMLEWSTSAQYKIVNSIDSAKYSIVVIHRQNGESILQDLLMHDFDLVLMDYHMAPFTGDKYINDIHYDMTFAYVPIMFYSQDPLVNLGELVKGLQGVDVCHRTALIDYVIRTLFK